MFHAQSFLERYITFLRVLAMLSFSVIILSSAIEIDLYSQKGGDLCIQPEWKSRYVSLFVSEKKKPWFVSRKPSRLEKATILYMLCICRERALVTKKPCATVMSHAILRNHLNNYFFVPYKENGRD